MLPKRLTPLQKAPSFTIGSYIISISDAS